ncbi:nuclear egress membrane protein [Saimiriine alphaherpesvirus 1]|uniref:Nuclear egress membrane protein n=1 Tax=Saimiriine herpesvirus 1 (strain MV-5-4-PSL) TaxID=10353 RepID=E2IUD5_SHV1|nr:nuclear egress membrane protein [Saimiriine alphaherpesvirus 1]ADO13793.1 nuclear egress membrane protein [Saimiriine alphaherpesvirus 1]
MLFHDGPRTRQQRAAGACEALLQRIRMVVPASLRGWECDPGPYSPANPPSRCVFQFNGQDGADDSFPIEYVLRLMSDWAEAPCDPYLRVQNTGVSVLFQGFFSQPSGAPGAPVTADHNNVILHSTETTGLALSDLDAIKKRAGLDTRPMMACMWVHCFVRMPRVQLAFRFMGPEDAGRMRRLLYRATEQAVERQQSSEARKRRDPSELLRREEPARLSALAAGAEPRSEPRESAVAGLGRRIWRLVCRPRLIPPWLAAGAAVAWVAASYWLWASRA